LLQFAPGNAATKNWPTILRLSSEVITMDTHLVDSPQTFTAASPSSSESVRFLDAVSHQAFLFFTGRTTLKPLRQ
jgi:hypothetical protein